MSGLYATTLELVIVALFIIGFACEDRLSDAEDKLVSRLKKALGIHKKKMAKVSRYGVTYSDESCA